MKKTPTRRRPESKPLSREDRIGEAAKIIDENRCHKGAERGSCNESIANILDWLEFVCTASRALRRTSSGETRDKEAQFAAWLRKGVVLLNGLYL
jgi:hypothetical protein